MQRLCAWVLFGAALLQAQGSLEIVAAYYGTERSFVDVTSQVRAQAQADGLGLTVGAESLGGDPFPGQLKSLRIYYKLSGQFQPGEWKDSETVLIGRLVNVGRRNPGVRGGIDRGGRGNSSTGLSILSAIYGAAGRTIDVTSVLQSRVQDNALDFVVPGTLLGDPAPGMLKELAVTYLYNGQRRETRVRDGDRLRLPADAVSVVPMGLRIVSAQYGLGARITDVTALLAVRVSGDRLSIVADNNAMGGDPARGADKVLTVVYEWNGQRATATAKEGQTLRLPPDSAAPAAPVMPANGVCFYPSVNFQGTAVCAALGQDQPSVTGTFGSVRLFGTVRQVDLFEQANYAGRTVRLTAETADLSRVTTGFFGTPATWATNLGSFRLSQ